jgi:hypothetical protein
MNQTTVLEAHIHKTAEIHNIEYSAPNFLTHLKRFHGQYAMAQQRRGEIHPDIITPVNQFTKNLANDSIGNIGYGCRSFGFDARAFRFDLLPEVPMSNRVTKRVSFGFELGKDPFCHRVLFRMNPGGIKRAITVCNPKKPNRLDIAVLGHPGNKAKLVAIGEFPDVFSVFHQVASNRRIQARDVFQGRNGRFVWVETNLGYSRFQNAFKGFSKVFALGFGRMNPAYQILRVDFYHFGKAIDESTANANRCPKRSLMVGKFFTTQGATAVGCGSNFSNCCESQSFQGCRQMIKGNGNKRSRLSLLAASMFGGFRTGSKGKAFFRFILFWSVRFWGRLRISFTGFGSICYFTIWCFRHLNFSFRIFRLGV